MMKRAAKWILAASALTLLAPASTAVAGGPVPISGTLIVVQGTVINPNPPIVVQTRNISGTLNVLGDVTGIALDHLDVTHFPSPLFFFDTFTVQNKSGDGLSGFASGILVFKPATGLYDVHETITITGGTGAFAGATGKAVGSGTSTPEGVATEFINGIIFLSGN
jgi:hypothetical protein